MTDTHLRQANAKVRVAGMVSDKKLEIKSDKGSNVIEGFITIKTSDTNFVRFDVRATQLTRKNESNPAYEGLVTVMDEYKSIADFGVDGADYIVVNGDISPYKSVNTGKEVIKYRGSFFSRISNVEGFTPEATFEIEMIIKTIIPEVNTDGEETGRVKVTGWVPTFNSIEPVELICPEENASALESVYEPGQTVEFYGDIIANRIVTRTEKPVAFGKPKIEVTSTYVNELVITGGSSPYEGESDELPKRGSVDGVIDKAAILKPYDIEVVKKAIEERDRAYEDRKNKAKSGNGNAVSGFGAKPSGAIRGRKMPQGW